MKASVFLIQTIVLNPVVNNNSRKDNYYQIETQD